MLRKLTILLALLGAALALPADALARGGHGGGGHGWGGHGWGGRYWGGGYWGGGYWGDWWPYYDYSDPYYYGGYYPYYYGGLAPVDGSGRVYYTNGRRYSSRCHIVKRSIVHHHQRYYRTVRVCHR